MYHQKKKTLIFVLWVLGYIAFLLSVRRMWIGKYVRSPLARSVFMNMPSDNEVTETREV